jgi:predicted MFS family arabinose efflux permease
MTQGDIGLLIAAIGLIGFFATLALDYYLNSYNRRR